METRGPEFLFPLWLENAPMKDLMMTSAKQALEMHSQTLSGIFLCFFFFGSHMCCMKQKNNSSFVIFFYFSEIFFCNTDFQVTNILQIVSKKFF